MPLQPPPRTLAGFPTRPPSPTTRTLYRIAWHRDRTSDTPNGPWRFSSRSSTSSGRFDLPVPDGTCYWSSHRYGAWLEAFRGAKLVDAADAAARRLWTATAPLLRLADLLSPKAYLYGVTAAISTQPDYTVPRLWAAALHADGFQGLVGTCSHDTTSTALNVAVFGTAGSPRRRRGWTTRAAPIDSDLDLLGELAAFGVHVADVPYHIETMPPPQT